MQDLLLCKGLETKKTQISFTKFINISQKFSGNNATSATLRIRASAVVAGVGHYRQFEVCPARGLDFL